MHALRARRLTRLVAAWVLAWFVALQATALLRPEPPVLHAAPSAAAHHAHGAEECEEHLAAQEHGPAEHTGATHLAQCPGCLFSTAPPPPTFVPPATQPAAVAPAPLAVAAAPRAASLPQPPARGPPRFA